MGRTVEHAWNMGGCVPLLGLEEEDCGGYTKAHGFGIEQGHWAQQ